LAQELYMSVPGRIGIILIVALALVDALILASGARRAATAIETHALASPDFVGDATSDHETLLSTALREISLIRTRAAGPVSGA
jgi:hypothetical protein